MACSLARSPAACGSVSRTVDQYKVKTKHLFCIYPQQKDYLRHWNRSRHCTNTQTQSFILFVWLTFCIYTQSSKVTFYSHLERWHLRTCGVPNPYWRSSKPWKDHLALRPSCTWAYSAWSNGGFCCLDCGIYTSTIGIHHQSPRVWYQRTHVVPKYLQSWPSF